MKNFIPVNKADLHHIRIIFLVIIVFVVLVGVFLGGCSSKQPKGVPFVSCFVNAATGEAIFTAREGYCINEISSGSFWPADSINYEGTVEVEYSIFEIPVGERELISISCSEIRNDEKSGWVTFYISRESETKVIVTAESLEVGTTQTIIYLE